LSAPLAWSLKGRHSMGSERQDEGEEDGNENQIEER
jgi:hypothetical protein